MLTAPYSIYVNNRPLRVAFLLENRPESLAIMDDILAYNRDRWGGRYNIIVVTDGKTLTDAWWALLEMADPDVITSFVPLSEDLIRAIETRLSPYHIQQPRGDAKDDLHLLSRIPDHGLSQIPSERSVRKASGGIRVPTFVLLDIRTSAPDEATKRFVEWNFGTVSEQQLKGMNGWEVEFSRIIVSSEPTVAHALTSTSFFKNYVYPIQLCSLPEEALPAVAYNPERERFHVVVGDAPLDAAYYWNRPMMIPTRTRSLVNQIWLPMALAANPSLAPVLGAWIRRYADPNGNFGGSVRFVSLSLPQQDLQVIAARIGEHLKLGWSASVLPEVEVPSLKVLPPGPSRKESLDFYRVAGSPAPFAVREPDVTQGFSVGDHWMADLYVEFHPENFAGVQGLPLWWQFPRRNKALSGTFGRPARILRTRFPSVLMRRGSTRLELELPTETRLLVRLVTGRENPFYSGDARSGDPTPLWTPYSGAKRSEKGRYLSGLLDIFGGLDEAAATLGERYWRTMFDRLSGRNSKEDDDALRGIESNLRSLLHDNPTEFRDDPKAMQRLSAYVLRLAQQVSSRSGDRAFGDFDRQAQLEHEEFIASSGHGEDWAYSQSDLKAALAKLIGRNVLLMGIEEVCPSCGYRAWQHVDHSKQACVCEGCSVGFPLRPEPTWFYRLNSLVRAAHAQHGLVPVLLVLNQLRQESRSSFISAPCLDLFDDDDERPIGDLDIAAVVDGQLVLGEVKQSAKLFKPSTFSKMETVARRLRPDRLLFASLDREPTKLVHKEIERLRVELRPIAVVVEWYQLGVHHFLPAPVR